MAPVDFRLIEKWKASPVIWLPSANTYSSFVMSNSPFGRFNAIGGTKRLTLGISNWNMKDQNVTNNLTIPKRKNKLVLLIQTYGNAI